MAGTIFRRYRDWDERELFVCSGISRGVVWGTFWRKRCKALRMRGSAEEAQADLDRYGAKHKLPECGRSAVAD